MQEGNDVKTNKKLQQMGIKKKAPVNRSFFCLSKYILMTCSRESFFLAISHIKDQSAKGKN
jgi:hypothetical protein